MIPPTSHREAIPFGPSPRAGRSGVAPRARRHISLLALLALPLLTTACGQKGPPLPPLRRVPAPVADVAARRYGDDVYIQLTVPQANVEGPGPANITRLEVYALTSTRPMSAEDAQLFVDRNAATRLGTQNVRPPLPPPEPGAATPPIPQGPGLDQGGSATFHEVLDAAALEPVAALPDLPPPRPLPGAPTPTLGTSPAEAITGAPMGPLVAPDAVSGPRRYYFAVGVTGNGRYGAWGVPVGVPLQPPPPAPAAVQVTYDEQAFTIRWPTAAGDGPAAPAPAPGDLPSRPLLPAQAPVTYDVFTVDRAAAAGQVAPAALNGEPLKTGELRVPGVAFGRERCFAVRAVDSIGDALVRSAPSTPQCVTPRDTFAPTSPKNLQAVSGAGTISLIWEANTESDLAGYVVLRGEAPGDTLTPLTETPVREPRFDDRTARPGVRYFYAIVALDTASPANRSAPSERAEETARQ